MLNAGLLVGGVMTQEYWEKRDRTPDAAREQANASVGSPVDVQTV
jgi:hypothetical protein